MGVAMTGSGCDCRFGCDCGCGFVRGCGCSCGSAQTLKNCLTTPKLKALAVLSINSYTLLRVVLLSLRLHSRGLVDTPIQVTLLLMTYPLSVESVKVWL